MCWDNKFSIPLGVCLCKYMLKTLGLTHCLKSDQALEIFFFLIGLRTFQYPYHILLFACSHINKSIAWQWKKNIYLHDKYLLFSIIFFVTALNDETLLLITDQILYEFSIPMRACMHTHTHNVNCCYKI